MKKYGIDITDHESVSCPNHDTVCRKSVFNLNFTIFVSMQLRMIVQHWFFQLWEIAEKNCCVKIKTSVSYNFSTLCTGF